MKADVIIVIAVYNNVKNDEVKSSAEGAELRAMKGASKPENVVKIRVDILKKDLLAPNLNALGPGYPLRALTKANEFLAQFAAALLPLRPMIAGYTTYMTRANGDQKLHLSDSLMGNLPNPDGIAKETRAAEIEKKAHERRETLVGAGPEVSYPLNLLTAQEKSKFKVAMQFDKSGNLVRIPLEVYKHLEATEHSVAQTHAVGSQNLA